MTSCTHQTLESYVKEKQKLLPIDTDEGFTVVGYEIEGDNVVVMMTCDDRDMPLAEAELMYSKDRDFYNKTFIQDLIDEGKTEFIYLCKKEGKGIKVLIKGNQSGRTATIMNVHPEELPDVK